MPASIPSVRLSDRQPDGLPTERLSIRFASTPLAGREAHSYAINQDHRTELRTVKINGELRQRSIEIAQRHQQAVDKKIML
jgi:hypothetical protein